MTSNLDRYKRDLDKLVALGDTLVISLAYHVDGAQVKSQLPKALGKEEVIKYLQKLPSFKTTYEVWYSESLALIRQMLPDRLANFISFYEKPKSRKSLDHDNYTIQDCLQGLQRVDGSVGTSAAIPKFDQQVAIVKACAARFDSSLFEIRQLVQADLFDSEIEAGRALLKHGFARAAGAIAGVVVEKHLQQVCDDHKIKVTKKHPGISDLNELLKSNLVISVPQWRHITLLADIRNLCDHNKGAEPTTEQVTDLLEGADKILKTIS